MQKDCEIQRTDKSFRVFFLQPELGAIESVGIQIVNGKHQQSSTAA